MGACVCMSWSENHGNMASCGKRIVGTSLGITIRFVDALPLRELFDRCIKFKGNPFQIRT